MKKLFTLFAAALMSLATFAQSETWSVCGTIPGLDPWGVTDTKGDMTTTDNENYTLEMTNVSMETGITYEFKVVKDHAWDEAYPSSNYPFTVDETAAYTLTITFNSTSHDINVSKVKTGDASLAEKTYSVVGGISGGWETDVDMTKGEDNVYTATFTNVAAGTYQFKVRVNGGWAEAYPTSGNESVTVESDGSTVVITFNADTKAITKTVTPATGINQVESAAAEGRRFTLSGQQVGTSYRGLVIVDGRKVMQR